MMSAFRCCADRPSGRDGITVGATPPRSGVEADEVLEDQRRPGAARGPGRAAHPSASAPSETGAKPSRCRPAPRPRPSRSSSSPDMKITRRPPLHGRVGGELGRGQVIEALDQRGPGNARATTAEDGRPPRSSSGTPKALVASTTSLPSQSARPSPPRDAPGTGRPAGACRPRARRPAASASPSARSRRPARQRFRRAPARHGDLDALAGESLGERLADRAETDDRVCHGCLRAGCTRTARPGRASKTPHGCRR